jgi:hypothetical protein
MLRGLPASKILASALICAGVFFAFASNAQFTTHRSMRVFYSWIGDAGSGADGNIEVLGKPNGPLNPYLINTVHTHVTANALSNQKNITVASTAGLAVNDEVLIIVMIGTGIGRYEINKIAAINANVLTMTNDLANFYRGYVADNEVVQVVRIPNYNLVTIKSGGFLTTDRFNGQSGGIMIFRAKDGIDIQYNATLSGEISIRYKGRVGGASNTPAGPPGGGGVAQGGKSTTPGSPEGLNIGGAGGGGTGATGSGSDGAGILMFFTPTLTLGGNISAGGEPAVASSGAGGGAGGTVALFTGEVLQGAGGNCGTISALGGAGNGVGTAGEDGRIFVFYYVQVNCVTGVPFERTNYIRIRPK